MSTTPKIIEVYTAAPNILVVELETSNNETGVGTIPDVIATDRAQWTVNNVSPVGVNRYSRPYDALPAISASPDDFFPITVRHRIYLTLQASFQAGQAYEVRTPYGNASLTFDPKQTYCESIRTNKAGYAKIGKVRYAYLGIYLGDGGSIRLSSLPAYEVYDERTGALVLRGTAVYAADETNNKTRSGQHVYRMRLDQVPLGGPYFVSIPSMGRSRSFGIGDAFFRHVAFHGFRAMYHTRDAIALLPEFTEYTHGMCHAEYADTRAPWSGDGFITVPPGTPTRQADGGYHDAGDFDVRPMHTRVPQITMGGYELFIWKLWGGQFKLPGDNTIPDVLREAWHGVRGWISMQITEPNDPLFGAVRRGKEGRKHPVYGVDSAANDHVGPYGSWDTSVEHTTMCAGLFANAARLMLPFNTVQATALQTAALNAYAYSEKHNGLLIDHAETVYASLQMYLLTGQQKYHDLFIASVTRVVINGGTWPHQFLPDNMQATCRTEHFLSYLLPSSRTKNDAVVAALRTAIFRLADRGGYMEVNLDVTYAQPASRSIGWGAITAIGRLGGLLAAAAVLETDATRKQGYYNKLSLMADWLLGGNPAGVCWMTGPWVDSIRSPLYLNSYFTKYGKSDGVSNDHLNKPKGNVPGIVVYGPSEGRSFAPYQLAGTNKFYPKYEDIPVPLRISDAWPIVNDAEGTIWELWVYTAMHLGVYIYDVTTDDGITPEPPVDTIINKIGPNGESVGSQVHYVNTETTSGANPLDIIAATVTGVNDDGTVAAKLSYPSGVEYRERVAYRKTYEKGFWSWPHKT